MARRKGVLALTVDGEPTMCYASEENRGKGRCNHVGHARPGETVQDFFNRVASDEKKDKSESKRRKQEMEIRESKEINDGKNQAKMIEEEQDKIIAENVKEFEDALSSIEREGIDKVIDYCREHDMYTAPSSTKFHLSVKGGLLQHSLNVYNIARNIMDKNEDGTLSYKVNGVEVCRVTEDTLKIATLLHDFCKMDTYKPYYKTVEHSDGSISKVKSYKFDEDLPMGHGDKSVYLLNGIISLTEEEACAIRWHMGAFGNESNSMGFSKAVSKYPIIWCIHSADMQAAQFMEAKTGNRKGFK